MTQTQIDGTTSLQLLHAHDGIALGMFGETGIILWRAHVNEARFAVQYQGVQQFTRRCPGRVTLMCVIEAGAPPPNEELRRAASDMLRDHEQDIRALACVIEGNGFSVRIARAVLSSIQLLLGRQKFPVQFYGRTVEASMWFAGMTRTPTAPLIAAVEQLRAHLDEDAGPRIGTNTH